MVVVGEIVAIVTILFGFSSMVCMMKSNCCQINTNKNDTNSDDYVDDENKLKKIMGSLRKLFKK